MDLKLNPKDQLPLHVQLKSQLAHLIETGQLQTGAQLPTVRQMAGFLRINRNTVAKVFSELEREGYLCCERGKGTFVSSHRSQAKRSLKKMQGLVEIVDEALNKAIRLGFTAEELSVTLYARTHTAPPANTLPRPRLLFIECNQSQVSLFCAELKEALAIEVDGMLLPDFTKMLRNTPASMRPYAFVVTTFYHIQEVQAALANTKIEVMGLLVEAGLETLMRLTTLAKGTKIGVACYEWAGTVNLKLSIENAGFKHLQLVPGCGEDEPGLLSMINQVSIIVCSILVAEKIQALTPKDKEIIVDDRRLDKGGIEMLRSRIKDYLQEKST
jgi:DNA-binding transcriptional regulator YhcF (GntR family)